MRVLICGAGRIVVEVLKRLGPKWQITIVEIDPERVKSLAAELQDKCSTYNWEENGCFFWRNWVFCF